MKVLLLNLSRVINSKGGVEKVFSDMGNALSELGHEVIALALDNTKGELGFPFNDKVKFINVGEGFVGRKGFVHKIKRAFMFKRLWRHMYDERKFDGEKIERLKPVIIEERPDIIITFTIEGTRLIKKITNEIPVITMFHFDIDWLFKEATEETIEALKKSECLQVLLKDDIDVVLKYIQHNNIVRIPNVVKKVEHCEANRDNVIINIGRINGESKRQHILIEAFHEVQNDFPEWCVELWGETNVNKKYFSYCNNLVKKYKLENRIKFCGTTSDVNSKLSKASIFVIPSNCEAWGLALSEAMSNGLPCIGFKSARGVNELIKDGVNGILCDDGSDALAQALTELMADKDKRLRYGNNARLDVEMYSPEVVWGMWEELLQITKEDIEKKKLKNCCYE